MAEISVDQIPQELKQIQGWVNWISKKYPDEKKPRKIPINPNTGFEAKVNDSETWGTFDESLKGHQKFKASGIGVMIRKGLIGIDLDNAVDPLGKTKSEAQKIISSIPTYWEFSPSGKGFHGFVFGSLPQGHRTRKKLEDGSSLEIYSSNRYFTVTGRIISQAYEITRNQDSADWLVQNFQLEPENTSKSSPKEDEEKRGTFNSSSKELIQKIQQSKQGAKFNQLFTGNWDGYGSQSEADLSLCSILAFWTGNDSGMIDEIFRQSGLSRCKWDELRGPKTYGGMTIEKAISQNMETYQAPSENSQQKNTQKNKTDVSWQSPEPLKPERAENPLPYPIQALSPIIREAVKEFISYTPVPPALAGSVALGVSSLVSQHHANVRIDAQNISPLSLFFMIEQGSGERKSTVSRAFLKPVFQWERNQKEIFNHDPEAEEKPLSRILYEDSTKESLIMDLAEGHKSGALWSDEAGVIFGGAGMNDNSPLGYLTLLNKAFSADKIVHRRKQSKSAEVESYRLSCLLMMQNSVLGYLLNLGKGIGSGWAEDTGFVSRFLFASPPSLIGYRTYSEAPEQTEAMDTFYARVSSLLAEPVPYSFEGLKEVQFSQASKKMWIEEFNRSENLCAPGSEYSGFGSVVSKHSERIARISGVLTVFEGSGLTVNEETMFSAIELGKWHMQESIRIIGAGSLKPETNDALDLIEWFRKNTNRLSENTERGSEQTNHELVITKRSLQQYGPIRIRNKTRRDSALKVLVENHWLKIVKKGQKQIIQINPLINSNR